MDHESERLARLEEELAHLRWRAMRIEILAWFIAMVTVALGLSASETSFEVIGGVLIGIAALLIVSLLLFALTHLGRLPSNGSSTEAETNWTHQSHSEDDGEKGHVDERSDR